MPRRARLDAPGILHHVIIRGIEKRAIFAGDRDRIDFLKRCEKLFTDTATACYAWALLSNHAHLLLRTGSVPLARVMARLLTGYATSFNRRHRRHGHVFQNRYKSIICQEDAYLKELVRYIHLNPLRAGIVPNVELLERFRWCGHGVLLGKQACSWQDSQHVLALFGRTISEARRLYRVFVREGSSQGRREELVGGGIVRSQGGWTEVKSKRRSGRDMLKGDERILGDSSFVMRVLADAGE